jgi:hypothetical protein
MMFAILCLRLLHISAGNKKIAAYWVNREPAIEAVSNVEIIPVIHALPATFTISLLRSGARCIRIPICAPSAPRFPKPQRLYVAMSLDRLLNDVYIWSVCIEL